MATETSSPALKYTFSWSDIHYKIVASDKQEKWILDGVSGYVRPGQVRTEITETLSSQMCAIMGPSGSGKTSLLNVLTGRHRDGAVHGEIRLNGRLRPSYWKQIIGYGPAAHCCRRYVEQDDFLYAHLTVAETLTFYADMKIAADRATKRERVDKFLDRFGLAAVRDTYIGSSMARGVSGGERKRVCVASEMISEPRLLFLDEPTSGLDAFNALSLVKAVKEYAAASDRTVLMTIHQPRQSLLDLFDNIVLLANGKCAFFGNMHDGIEHFARLGHPCPSLENPGDHFLDLLTVNRESPEAEAESRMRIRTILANSNSVKIPEGSDGIEVPECNFATRPWYQFVVLLQRDFRLAFRNVPELVGAFASDIIMALFIGFTFFQLSDVSFAGLISVLGLLLYVTGNSGFVLSNAVVPVFVLDRRIFLKERYAHTFRLSCAFFARFISLLPQRFFSFTIEAFIIYYLTGLRTDSFAYFLVFWAINMAQVFTSCALGLIVAASVPSIKFVQICNTIVVGFGLLFTGAFTSEGQITWILRWIRYIDCFAYAFDAYALNELTGRMQGDISGDEFLRETGIGSISLGWNATAVVLLGIVYMSISYIGLHFNTRPVLRLKTLPSIRQ